MMSHLLLRALFGASLCLLAASTSLAEDAELAARISRLQQGQTLEVQGVRIATGGLIADYYAQRGYDLAFDDRSIRDVLDGVEGMRAHGLDPDDYHRQALSALRGRALSPAERADLDLLLMDAFLRMASHRTYGESWPNQIDTHIFGGT